MYLSSLKVQNFRRFKEVTFDFVEGLNVIIGENNIGKTALVDALRSLLAGHEEPYPRFTEEDIHKPSNGERVSGDIVFTFIFSGLSRDDEADFLHALVPIQDDRFEAHIGIRFSKVAGADRMKTVRWCGEREDISMTSDMLENLRGVYLQPLRDASQGLKPGRNSQMAKLMRLMGEKDEHGKESVELLIRAFEKLLQRKRPVVSTGKAITTRHSDMLGEQLAQELALGVSGTDFRALTSKLSLSTDGMDVDYNGLGFNNLIFMAIVLSEMIKDPTAAYRGLIVEEPEAHLHPQLQVILLEYLKGIKSEENEGDVQLFVTSHSSNFASLADLNSLTCLVANSDSVKVFSPRDVQFSSSNAKDTKRRKKLERYLDITKAELFFARKLMLVEGAAELMLMDVLAQVLGFDFKKSAVSTVSVEGLNFDCFLPLMGEGKLSIPVSVITDADPEKEEDESGKKTVNVYPAIEDEVEISANTVALKACEDKCIKVFHGVKTFEYDLALYEENIPILLKALAEIHPKIAKEISEELKSKITAQEKATAIFCGMFERGKGKTNVQKGRFSQELAYQLSMDSSGFIIPKYIKEAISHVCN